MYIVFERLIQDSVIRLLSLSGSSVKFHLDLSDDPEAAAFGVAEAALNE